MMAPRSASRSTVDESVASFSSPDLWPPAEGEIRRDDDRAALVALTDDLVEAHRLVALQRAQAEVVDDEQVGAGEARQAAVVGAVAARRAQLGQHLVRRDVEGRVPGDTGTATERLRDVALADAGLADEANVLAARDEGAGGELEDLGARHLRVEGEVEVLERALVLEARAPEPLVELLRVAALDLVGEQPIPSEISIQSPVPWWSGRVDADPS